MKEALNTQLDNQLFDYELESVNGKNILITGGTTGIGRSTALLLAAQGVQVMIFGRHEQELKDAIHDIQATGGTVSGFTADTSNPDDIRRVFKEVDREMGQLDILINNAGTWEMKFIETNDGIETNFQVNHLSPMLLTLQLLPLLERSQNARIIYTSSGAHRRNIIDFDDIEWRKKPYDGIATYSQSKLFNLLFSLKLSSLLANTNITITTVHPGYVQTALFNKMGQRDWNGVPDAAHGARSTLYAALSPELEGVSGKYIYLEREDPGISSLAQDEKLAEKLWSVSMGYISKYLPG